MEHPWIFARCREVQADPDGHIDLWAREHYKSTIITFGLTIMDVLASHGDDPLPDWGGREVCVGIFSFTRPSAVGFLRQIKREFEGNALLLDLFPDIFYGNPKREAAKWSEYEGLIVKRQSNPKESTVEAWGIVDSQPTGKHFPIRVYDDVVEKSAVRTPDAIGRTTQAWASSLDLGAAPQIVRYIGTRWHHADTYREMIQRGAAVPRIHAITAEGTVDGTPVLKSQEEVAEKRRLQGAYTFSAQQLQNPTGDSVMGFKLEWLRYYNTLDLKALNLYILVDPAREKKADADFTVIEVWGYGADENYYLVDAIRDRLALSGRRDALFAMHRKYAQYGKLWVGYEKTGAQADLESIHEEQERQTYRFDIRPMHSVVPKNARIGALEPVLEEGRVYLPRTLVKTGSDGTQYDFVDRFINDEYLLFPLPVHDDMLDCMAWLVEGSVPVSRPNREEESVESWVSSGSSWV